MCGSASMQIWIAQLLISIRSYTMCSTHLTIPLKIFHPSVAANWVSLKVVYWPFTCRCTLDCCLSLRFRFFLFCGNLIDLNPPKIYPFHPTGPPGMRGTIKVFFIYSCAKSMNDNYRWLSYALKIYHIWFNTTTRVMKCDSGASSQRLNLVTFHDSGCYA